MPEHQHHPATLPGIDQVKLVVIGLGYVGLPLAVEFGKQHQTIGFDINCGRIAELAAGNDATLEVSDEELREASRLAFTADLMRLAMAMCLSSRFRPRSMPIIGPTSPRWSGPAKRLRELSSAAVS